ncbi:phenylalanine--tRNA ligase subunit alpha [Candidatus Dojkabacteria bacterium]|jgi:phenylalanyl-tRNA synthetase alpha chain|nr:phenylalanine--tRNA ligase subunit alpha [Candidatus Dojkabacteria bacterium]
MEFEVSEIKKVFEEIENDFLSLGHDEISQKYLSKQGVLKKLLSGIGDKKPEERKQYGKEINDLKTYVTEKLSLMADTTDTDKDTIRIDPTAPFDINTPVEKRPKTKKEGGSIHPIMKEMKYILNIFSKMGFDIEESRQLDDDYHMFESLNFPVGHPARDMYDSFRTDEDLIPPAQTSTMQNRIMKKYNPPIRVVIPGRCFRNEATDASHEHTFYQIEGVYVDKGISLGDMLGTIQTYLEGFFNTKLEIKVQPSYFPFVEPGCEFLISCPFCKKTGCSVCGYNGWMEVMGCGMIHPNVLTEAGINPKIYSGFAWGFGLDRLVMIKNGITDIRKLHGGDINFLKQF